MPILCSDFGAIYNCLWLFHFSISSYFFLLTFLSFKHHFSLCSQCLPFPFGQETFPSNKYHFFACAIPLFFLRKNLTLWQTSPGLTEHKCGSNYSVWYSQLELFSTTSNFPLSSTWLVSTSRGFVQLLTTLEPSLCFCLNTFNRILDFLQLKNILLLRLQKSTPFYVQHLWQQQHQFCLTQPTSTIFTVSYLKYHFSGTVSTTLVLLAFLTSCSHLSSL